MKIQPDESCPCGSGKMFADCHGARLAEHPEITKSIPLEVISEPDPETRSVIQGMGESPLLFRGTESGVAYTCGKCQAPLIIGVGIDRIQNVVLGCARCGSFNETRPRLGPSSAA